MPRLWFCDILITELFRFCMCNLTSPFPSRTIPSVLVGPTSEVRISPRALGMLRPLTFLIIPPNLLFLFIRGRLVFDRTTKQPKLNCRNWECGVVVPVLKEKKKSEGPNSTTESETDDETETHQQTVKGKGVESGANSKAKEESTGLLDIFIATVPVPMRLPGQKYGGSGPKKPWYFMEEKY